LAMRRRREVVRDLTAFMFLPFYAIWRLVTGLVDAVSPRGKKAWVRTDRS